MEKSKQVCASTSYIGISQQQQKKDGKLLANCDVLN